MSHSLTCSVDVDGQLTILFVKRSGMTVWRKITEPEGRGLKERRLQRGAVNKALSS